MLKSLEQWLEEDVSKVKDKSVKWLSELYFHREVSFSKKINSSLFYAPASGTIINACEKVSFNECMTEIKGKVYSLSEVYGDLLDLDETKDYLVIDIYMSFYDQHFNYAPYPGFRYYEELPPVKSYNLPMLAMEKEILKGVINPELCVDYVYDNGRILNTFDSPKLGEIYHVIQIADFDVSKILSFEDQGEHLHGTQKFGKITLGSQCTLIVPHSDKYELKLQEGVQVGVHCEATDGLVKINWK